MTVPTVASGRRPWMIALGAAVGILATLAGAAAAQPLEPDARFPGGDVLSGGSRWRFTPVERCFMRKVNRHRDDRGLGTLARDRQMGFIAREHARDMAASRGVWHDRAVGMKITNWVVLAQNTGKGDPGRRCAGLFRAFWESRPHRSNILGKWRYHAVGVARAQRRLYVQMLFESQRNPGNVYGTP